LLAQQQQPKEQNARVFLAVGAVILVLCYIRVLDLEVPHQLKAKSLMYAQDTSGGSVI
jgi:hypothetical protein